VAGMIVLKRIWWFIAPNRAVITDFTLFGKKQYFGK
jgi:hypothetical protein